jgi:uracil-DNA glycosylase family 4
VAIPGKLRECHGCPLYTRGEGFAAGELVQDSMITLVGEALGFEEVVHGAPFVGPAGWQLDRALKKVGLYRGSVTIGNSISCRPPNNWLSKAPWEHACLNHCRVHRQNFYKPTTRVYVTLGAVATRTVLSDHGYPYEGKLENWHSTVVKLDDNQFLVPTFHPSYLLQGNQKLFNAQCFALRLAMEIATFGWDPPKIETHVDPPPDIFEANFVRELEHLSSDSAWIAVDIETSASLGEEEDSYFDSGLQQITRVNFATDVHNGWTVPWENRYIDLIQMVLKAPNPKVFWNERFDVPILKRNGMEIKGVVIDAMQGWHMLQPNLPMGLGFVAPFYCKVGPWKHLSSTAAGRYAALDAAATLQCAYGIAQDLKDESRWDTFHRYMTVLDHKVLHPAEDVGLLIDKDAVKSLQDTLDAELAEIEGRIQTQIPSDVLPLEGGWKRDPGDKWPGAFKKRVEQVTTCCTECGETDVTTRHECSE